MRKQSIPGHLSPPTRPGYEARHREWNDMDAFCKAQRQAFCSVLIIAWERTTVTIVKTLVSSAQVSGGLGHHSTVARMLVSSEWRVRAS